MTAGARMPDKLESVLANWFPRFLANGLDYFDVVHTLEDVHDWNDWDAAWTRTADEYAALGERALAAGHRVSAAEHLRRSALTLQFAQFVLTDRPERRAQLQQRMAETYRRCAPLLDPPAVPIRIPYGGDHAVIGYLRVPSGVHRPGVVLLLPGLESTKEQFSTYEPYFLRRGMATLSVEGPGQGEGGRDVPFRDAGYADAVAAVARSLPGLDGIDPHRAVVVGTSFGGYLALRHASLVPDLLGIVDIAGPYDLAEFESLQDVTREGFRDFVGAADQHEAARLLADVNLAGRLAGVAAPVLIVHGEQDRIIPVEHARRIAADLGARATLHLEPAGNHSCNNRATVVRPLVADWALDRMEGTS